MAQKLSKEEIHDLNNKSEPFTKSQTTVELTEFEKQCSQELYSMPAQLQPLSAKEHSDLSDRLQTRESILQLFRETTTKQGEQETLMPFLGFLQSDNSFTDLWARYYLLEMSKPRAYHSFMTEILSPEG